MESSTHSHTLNSWICKWKISRLWHRSLLPSFTMHMPSLPDNRLPLLVWRCVGIGNTIIKHIHTRLQSWMWSIPRVYVYACYMASSKWLVPYLLLIYFNLNYACSHCVLLNCVYVIVYVRAYLWVMHYCYMRMHCLPLHPFLSSTYMRSMDSIFLTRPSRLTLICSRLSFWRVISISFCIANGWKLQRVNREREEASKRRMFKHSIYASMFLHHRFIVRIIIYHKCCRN